MISARLTRFGAKMGSVYLARLAATADGIALMAPTKSAALVFF